MTVRSMALLVLISVIFFVMLRTSVGVPWSADLRSMWLAGSFFSDVDIGTVYRPSEQLFSMQPPDAWIDSVLAEGIKTPVYPFIYPPLWAWLMSFVTPLTTMSEFGRIMGIINPCLVILSALLAMRITAPMIPRPVFLTISLGLASGSIVFLLPLNENQPQILVAFLTLLGIERTRSGAPIAGGAAMAFAASLKLYPLVFALVWLAAGYRSATLSFAVFGGALGLLSIVVAGWPMHAAYLSELSVISKTLLMSRANFSLDPLIGVFTIPQSAQIPIDTLVTGGDTNWMVAQKSQAFLMVSALAQFTMLAFLLLLARRTGMRDPLLWPFVIIAVSWVSPLSWLYHYLAAFLFLPALFDRLDPKVALSIVLLCVLPTNYVMFDLELMSALDSHWVALVNNAALLLMAAAYLWLALRHDDIRQHSG
ncbi:MAG: DUF2029 domain-containing protein [Silicimonas sp.]|nr:DUF2029 domain-containing protein [Silicimonas sp.]